MRLTNIHGFATIDEYVKYKVEKFAPLEKSFENLFDQMFDETDNVFAETSDGYRVKKITYGQMKERILSVAPTLKDQLSDIEQGSIVGLYMANSLEWIEIFWSILVAGYRPLLMNAKLPNETLESIISEYSVGAVISDGKQFSVPTVSKDAVTVPSDKPRLEGKFGTEVIFMSSGTTNNVKLCVYTAENFYYQILDSRRIIEQCPDIKRHYEGELKQLVLLPLYHVFGFIAVYLWFSFFSRTFVFPKDLNPDTIRHTVKKHKVTHIFAVPMVWDGIYKAVTNKIRQRGEKTYKKFRRVVKLSNKLGRFGDFLARKLLSEIRDGLFGDSITFMITGGSHISEDTLSFFNGIGYHLANGYGMTEIGITSLEKSGKKKIINSASIGAPFGQTEYSVSEDGTLLVKGKTRASKIICAGVETVSDFDEWFSTGDLVRFDGQRYYSQGRSDDLIICENGENLNPLLVEEELKVAGIDKICLFAHKGTTLLASVPGCFSGDKLDEIYTALKARLSETKLDRVINGIHFTHEALLQPGEFKISRKKIAKRFASGEIRSFDPARIQEHVTELYSGLEEEIRACFAEALGKDVSEIGKNDNFFRELEGNSIDYFALLGIINSKLGVAIVYSDGDRLATVAEIADFIKSK